MKRLTAVATIGLPFTVVSGYVGMNVEIMPWLKESWGIAAATTLTALTVTLSSGAIVLVDRVDRL